MTSIIAFTPDQACRVSGLSRRQLTYWDNTGFFHPKFSDESPRFSRMYSFRDVVGLRTIAMLRGRLSLQELRKVGEWLHERYEEPWSELRFSVFGRNVVFDDGSGVQQVAGSGQVVLSILLGDVERAAKLAAEALLDRQPEQLGNIVRSRNVQHNAWVVDGTRIPTSAIFDFFLAGFGAKAIQKEYPRLTTADIQAAIAFEQKRALKAG